MILKPDDELEIEKLYRSLHKVLTTWADECLMIEEFHRLKCVSDANWTIRKTAALLKISIGAVSENVRLAREVRKRPELAELSRYKALIVLRKGELKL